MGEEEARASACLPMGPAASHPTFLLWASSVFLPPPTRVTLVRGWGSFKGVAGKYNELFTWLALLHQRDSKGGAWVA